MNTLVIPEVFLVLVREDAASPLGDTAGKPLL
jgi:hypothetical protein